MVLPDKKEICAITVFKKTWDMLNHAKSLDDAKEQFKKLLIELILE